MNLTEATVGQTKAPKCGRKELTDDKERGLVLRITANNSRSWALKASVGGKTKRVTLGPAQSAANRQATGAIRGLTLAEARRAAAATRLRLLDGADPVAEKRQERAEAEQRAKEQAARAITLADLLDHFAESTTKTLPRSWPEQRKAIEAHHAQLLPIRLDELTAKQINASVANHARRASKWACASTPICARCYDTAKSSSR